MLYITTFKTCNLSINLVEQVFVRKETNFESRPERFHRTKQKARPCSSDILNRSGEYKTEQLIVCGAQKSERKKDAEIIGAGKRIS